MAKKLSSLKKIDLTGTVRARTATETLTAVRPLFPQFGITRVARVTGLDTIGIPTSICIRPNARHLATAQGKGLTQELADISAIMESIEGYHAETVRAPTNYFSFREMTRKRLALDPRLLERGPRWKIWNMETPMRWVKGYELIRRQTIWIPFIALTMDSTAPHPEFAILQVSTNGLASGNNWVEAVLHALYELVERDSEFRWSLLSARRRAATLVDPETIDTPFLRDLLTRLRIAKQLPLIWDITSRLGVPTFRCVLIDQDAERNLGRFHGSGSHLVTSVALSRALTEAAQARLTWISGSREDVFPYLYRDMQEKNQPAVELPTPRLSIKNRQDAFSGLTLQDDLDWIVEKLRINGYPLISVFSHTGDDLPISVVTVLVPGMSFSGNRI
ncbi:MAG: hypothetical protein E7813_20485 [Bradyrhizobium sp.]|uniref:YcaO-like family protein n=1 Tax=Bradyrhizobium sp. TaxID=376 RepID=UPI00120F68AD|nr:YcaO-like family protein [Bradyrhizobium sp.]THD62547.1 MAG: hypothetical protein E7813_20485 [Bradyrhizobium sp.]